MKLTTDFYQREDTLQIARDLLGKSVFSSIDGELCGGIIIETEAYMGPDDRGSHTFNNLRTPRNEMMFSAGGVVYMYICYGIHNMLNIVTGSSNMPHAILIRAIEPNLNLEVMRDRRNIFNDDVRLCKGPGALCKALGLNKTHNGTDLQSEIIWVEDTNFRYSDSQIKTTPRVGMNFEGEYKSIPWRFYAKGNKYVSRPNT